MVKREAKIGYRLQGLEEKRQTTSQKQIYQFGKSIYSLLEELRTVEDQVLSILAGTRGHLDTIAVSEVRRFEREMLTFFQEEKAELRSRLSEGGKFTDELREELEAVIVEFRDRFLADNPEAKAA